VLICSALVCILSFQVFSWRTYDDIINVVIPFITSVKDVEQDIIDTSTNTTAVAESRTKVAQLEEARKGWQSVVDRNDKLYVDARAGKLTRVTQLVANALLQDATGNDNVKYINGTQAPNADALRAISALRFVHLCNFKPFFIYFSALNCILLVLSCIRLSVSVCCVCMNACMYVGIDV
jgi:hypothetical protein